MSKNKKNTRRRRDTRMSLDELCRIADISPRQKLTMRRYIEQKIKGVSIL